MGLWLVRFVLHLSRCLKINCMRGFLVLSESWLLAILIFFFFSQGDWEWEWDWNCIIPNQNNQNCVYESGQTVAMPTRNQAIFEQETGRNFKVGVPFLFMVRVRVREEGVGGEVVAEGRWEEVFNFVEEGAGLEVVETRWMCGDSSVGYSV